MEMAYRRGRIYEEIGEMFRDAPIPKGLPEEDAQVYRDVLEEKYLEALDAALPKYEAAIRQISALGVDGKWLTRIKERVKFINPMSEALKVQVADRTRKSEEMQEQREVALEEGGEVPTQPQVDRRLQRNLRRIQNIMDMNIDVADKIAQLRSLERDTQREIRREEEKIAELKDTLGVGKKKEEKTAQR
jgi:transcription initiation factor TFIIIB Brf1 subunit/transcription initiation factor TFIIB